MPADVKMENLREELWGNVMRKMANTAIGLPQAKQHPLVDQIIDGLVERLTGKPGELGEIVKDVKANPLDQLALAALADKCEEMGLQGIGDRFRKVSPKSGDIIVLTHPGRLTPQARQNLRDSFQAHIIDFLAEQGIKTRLLLLEEGMTLQLLRVQGES